MQISTDRNRRRTALYGGAFDPIHRAHLALAESVLESGLVDRVVFIPAAQSPLKKHGCFASDAERWAMLELAIEGRPSLSLDDFELRKGGVSYTVETVRHYREEHPDEDLFWILGADQVEQLRHWRAIEELCELTEFLVFARPGHTIDVSQLCPTFRYHVIESSLMQESSSEIRRRIQASEPLEDWLPQAVEAFISLHELYK